MGKLWQRYERARMRTSGRREDDADPTLRELRQIRLLLELLLQANDREVNIVPAETAENA